MREAFKVLARAIDKFIAAYISAKSMQTNQ